MQFAIFSAALVVSIATMAYSSPIADPETVNLFNGSDDVAVEIGKRGLLEERNVCSGSSRCSNSQSMKLACAGAYSRIQNTVYSNGGDKSGVCDGHCGLFVQGTYKDSAGKKHDCTASADDLANAYQTIQGNGCQTCGWVQVGPAGCVIKTDYVAHC